MQNHAIETTELMGKLGLGYNTKMSSTTRVEKKDRNLIKMIVQFYTGYVVKKFINATINVAL